MKKKPTTIKEALASKLTKKQLKSLPTSFDVVGDIAIIDIPEELKKKQKLIADTLLSINKNIKVVCKKAGIHKGQFRTQKLTILSGERRKETEHRETGARLRLNPETVYFSVRLSTERKRIAELVKRGESVLVMFSGVAPYPVVIAKNAHPKEIYAVEKNPKAHSYAVENIKINKLDNIKLYKGDVKITVPKLKKKFDRILMPLPKSAEDFLDTALKASKKGTIVHFYDFLHIDEFNKAKKKIKSACKTAKKKCRILRTTKCGQHAPRVFRICVDFKII